MAAPIVLLHSLMVDCKTCRCLKTLSTIPERKVRTQKSLAYSVDNDLEFKRNLMCPCSERVLGDHAAYRGVRALWVDWQLLAESRR